MWSRLVGRKNPPHRLRPEHALAVRDVQAAALLGADPADRREDLDRLAHHGAAGAQPGGQVLLGGHPVAGMQRELADQLQDLLGHQLVAGPVGAGCARGRRAGCDAPLRGRSSAGPPFTGSAFRRHRAVHRV